VVVADSGGQTKPPDEGLRRETETPLRGSWTQTSPTYQPTTMKQVDLNIGLAIGQQNNALSLARCNLGLSRFGFLPVQHRVYVRGGYDVRGSQSGGESTYAVRCAVLGSHYAAGISNEVPERIHALAVWLDQECIAAVPRCATPPFLVGPAAHKWGGCFEAQLWISVD